MTQFPDVLFSRRLPAGPGVAVDGGSVGGGETDQIPTELTIHFNSELLSEGLWDVQLSF